MLQTTGHALAPDMKAALADYQPKVSRTEWARMQESAYFCMHRD